MTKYKNIAKELVLMLEHQTDWGIVKKLLIIAYDPTIDEIIEDMLK